MQTDRRELTALLVRLSDGDRSAFDPVYDRVWPLVRASCARWVGEDQAEDVAQSALLKVFDQASSFDPERGDALAWVLTITWWESRSARRSQRRRKETFSPEPFEGRSPFEGHSPFVGHLGEPSPEQRLVSAELGAELHRVLAELSPLDAEVLWISATEADRGDLPAATFRKRLQRAVARLREAWRARHG